MILDLHGFGDQLLAGTWMTLKLSLAAVCVGLLLGLLGAIAKTSKYAALRFVGGTYTTIVRGVPETLWVLMIYFGTVSGLNALGDLFGKPDLALSPFAAGTLALGLCFGAYATEVFRGALLSIPRGHREAGQALGLSPGRIFWRIVLPQIWRVALPGLGNLYLILLKDTALVSLITLDEIMRKAQVASNATKEPFTFYMTAARHLPEPHGRHHGRPALPRTSRRPWFREERAMSEWELILKWMPKMLQGAALTLELLAIAVVAGLALALPLGIARASRHWYVRAVPYAYIFFFRGTPLLLQLFIVYYGLAQFEEVRKSAFWPYLRDPYWCALLTMTLHTAAYIAEILRGAIHSVPVGEVEAARALGMSRLQALWHIILPRAVRIGLPAYSNEVILMLKASAVVYTVTLFDIMGMARTIIARTYESMLFFCLAGALYLVITIVLTRIFRLIERWLRVDATQGR